MLTRFGYFIIALVVATAFAVPAANAAPGGPGGPPGNSLSGRVADLEAENAAQQTDISNLSGRVTDLENENTAQQAEIDELRGLIEAIGTGGTGIASLSVSTTPPAGGYQPSTISFIDALGTPYSLEVPDPLQNTGNAQIRYQAAALYVPGRIYLNIESTPGNKCAVVHNDDKVPNFGSPVAIATDAGVIFPELPDPAPALVLNPLVSPGGLGSLSLDFVCFE